jgi:hypothetical protein
MPKELTSAQWNQLLSLLSMDVALPFYPAMAVPVENSGPSRAILRQVIVDARRKYEENPSEVPDVVSMFMTRLEPAVADQFRRWARNIFLGYHADQPDWSAWDIVFSQWAYSRRKDLEFLPEEKRNSLVTEYRQNATTDDIKQLANMELERPLSDWDVEMYSRRNYGASWESGPFSTIEAIVRIERLKSLVQRFWPMLDDRERQMVQSGAQKLIEELGVWIPGPLPSLNSLLEQL